MNNSLVSYNTIGVASSGGPVGFANTDFMFNATAITGSTISFGNNRLFANTASGMAPSPGGGPSTDLGQQ
jgi:hypothetical protein